MCAHTNPSRLLFKQQVARAQARDNPSPTYSQMDKGVLENNPGLVPGLLADSFVLPHARARLCHTIKKPEVSLACHIVSISCATCHAKFLIFEPF